MTERKDGEAGGRTRCRRCGRPEEPLLLAETKGYCTDCWRERLTAFTDSEIERLASNPPPDPAPRVVTEAYCHGHPYEGVTVCRNCISPREEAFEAMRGALIEIQKTADPIWEDGIHGIKWRNAKRLAQNALSMAR